MTEVKFNCGFSWLADQCERHIGPRKFYLHNRVGGEGWDVRPGLIDLSNGCTVPGAVGRFDDPKMATYIMLKMK